MTTPLSRRSFGAVILATLMTGAIPLQVWARSSHERERIMSMVLREAVNMDVSISLALAVAHVESNFDARALSHKGARGVMQIMPRTARSEYGISPDELWNPRTNIRIGLHFLGRLIDGYSGRTEIALSHYNGGSSVRRGGRLRIIPATRPYVEKVKRIQFVYRRKILRGLL